ncbi:hypothetical protein K438DRAFT_1865309, partial [Mycena galopus ATCC 62051]
MEGQRSIHLFSWEESTTGPSHAIWWTVHCICKLSFTVDRFEIMSDHSRWEGH